MSRAEPMSELARAARYGTRFGQKWTPRQNRRYWHKIMHRQHPAYEVVYEDIPAGMEPKGRPTPRREDAQAARRREIS